MTTRPFQQVDVFTAVPFKGNPVAVILDGNGLVFGVVGILDDIPNDKQMLENELSAVGQNLVEFHEAPRQEIRFRLIMTGERMRAFDDPVDLIVYMLEKARSIALLKTLEDLSDVVFSDHWFLLYIYVSTRSLDV